MARVKASDWHPKGIELYEMRGLFGPKLRQSILEALGSTSSSLKRRRELRNRTLNTAAILNAALHYAKAPSSAEIKAAIKPVAQKAQELLAALQSLDRRSLEKLQNVADLDAINNASADHETPRMEFAHVVGGEERHFVLNMGPERVTFARSRLDDILKWSNTILIEESQKTTLERSVRAEAIRDAVKSLMEIWRFAWMHRPEENPTHLKFTPFVRLVLSPVLIQYGEVDDLSRAVEDVLYR